MTWLDPYQRENVTVLHIDCMDYMRTVDDNFFDIAIVDPPYGIGEDGKSNHSRVGKTMATRFTPKDWDCDPMPPEYFQELFRVSRHQIIFGANHFISRIPHNSPCWIVWDKKVSGDFSDCELAWTSFKTSVRKFTFAWNGYKQGDMRQKQKRIHPTQKPIQLYSWILQKYAQPSMRILDTHMGSGSSAIAALDFGCEYVGCEIDKEYVELAVQRIDQHVVQPILMFA